jgi:hypothetical protein
MTRLAIVALATTGLIFAQTQPPSGGWPRVGDAPRAPSAPAGQAQDPEPVDRSDAYGQQPQLAQRPMTVPEQSPATTPATSRQAYGLPADLILKPGTYVTVRIGQALSSDHNRVGDAFTAHLTQPIVVDGVVVAQRNQTVYGRVDGVVKQSTSKPSQMALELTSITLADGTQLPVHSSLIGRTGTSTPTGVQAGTVAATTGAGAIIGGAVGWGTGAAIGAGAGAVAGLAGVLLTRNHPTVVYPETPLTFSVNAQAVISTTRAPQAFRFVGPEDFDQAPVNAQLAPRPAPRPAYGAPYGAGYGPYGYPAPYPYPYPYAYAPYPYWGPSVGIVVGGGWGWGRWGRWR